MEEGPFGSIYTVLSVVFWFLFYSVLKIYDPFEIFVTVLGFFFSVVFYSVLKTSPPPKISIPLLTVGIMSAACWYLIF
jgi:Mn2+/Fe2+ NRAMP family transporter